MTIPVESHDEIGELAEGFNNMVEKLREREALEKRLYEAEHLSRVGQLASGIAHEIRNPLNYISLAIDHLKTEMLPTCGDKCAELTELTDKIKEEVRRANYMVLNFMNYGRPLKLRRPLVPYGEILSKVLPLLNDRLTEQRIRIEQEIDAGAATSLGRPGVAAQLHPQLHQQCRPGHERWRGDTPGGIPGR